MTSYMVDTSVASLMFQKRPELAQSEPHLTGANLHICFQTVAEMRLGALNRSWSAPRAGVLEAFLLSLATVQCTDQLCHCWAQIMHESKLAGRRLEAGDAWIAASALLLNVPLITHDRDFISEACPSISVICYADSGQ